VYFDPWHGHWNRCVNRSVWPPTSRDSGDGSNVSGPAPKPLAWYRLSLAPEDGQLVVDLANEVDRDFRLTV
jgi:hypothetical protein